MREREIAYWEGIAEEVTEDGKIRDNFAKREVLMRFLSKVTWTGKRVLEIGVGAGVSAGALMVCCGGKWDYIGTDLSPKFAEAARKAFLLNVVQADVLSLPAGPFDRIMALDSLEHVRPEDRLSGYRAIAERLVDGGLLLINMPCNRSLHDDEFDHGFNLRDIADLEVAGLTLQKYELYEYYINGKQRLSAFVTMHK